MTDFWRIANVIVVAAVIALVIWLQKRKKNRPQVPKPAKLDELNNRKQKLACELKAYEADLNEFEVQSRQIMEDYFARQEIHINELIKKEINVALDEMEAKVKADMRQSFDNAKTTLQKKFDDKEH